MKRTNTLYIIIGLLTLFTSGASAQHHMRDVFAQMPDSLLPLLTQNNRLDCIDFIENNMPAKVKNRFDTYSELKTLTANYLLLRPSAHSQVEMKLFTRAEQGDTILCMVHTVESRNAADSYVRFYDLAWNELSEVCSRPQANAFMDEGIDIEARGILCGLTLIKASLSAETPTLTWQLQTGVLPPDLREKAIEKVHDIQVEL